MKLKLETIGIWIVILILLGLSCQIDMAFGSEVPIIEADERFDRNWEESDVDWENIVESDEEQRSMIKAEDLDRIITFGIPDINEQLDILYKEVGSNLHINYMYVKMLHLIAGGKVVYLDKRPNIYSDLTIESLPGAFDIAGVNQDYNEKATWVDCPDDEVQRPNKYYLPDAAYSVASDIIAIMNGRYNADRGTMRQRFNDLDNETKTNILFCEAVLKYIGAEDIAVESFYTNYERILYEKEKGENIFEVDRENGFIMKEKFQHILRTNNIGGDKSIRALSIILSFDSRLAYSSNEINTEGETIVETIEVEDTADVTPYEPNVTTRENMMAAAMSLVGKVRYVWGGGHGTTGMVNGINPAWKAFFDAYPTDSSKTGYLRSVRPNGPWCPIHGAVHNSNACLFYSKSVYSVDEYIQSRRYVMNTLQLVTDKTRGLLNEHVTFKNGITSHRLDGLDCSGFASWLYNQITERRQYDCGATAFIKAGNLQVVDYGSRMLPGDVFSWGTHIVVVVGPARENSKAYVIVESAPNMVKFGSMYYSEATQSDRSLAYNIAREANTLFGNIPLDERTSSYNMDNLGFRTETVQVEVEAPVITEESNSENGEPDNNEEVGVSRVQRIESDSVETTGTGTETPVESSVDVYSATEIDTEPTNTEEDTELEPEEIFANLLSGADQDEEEPIDADADSVIYGGMSVPELNEDNSESSDDTGETVEELVEEIEEPVESVSVEEIEEVKADEPVSIDISDMEPEQIQAMQDAENQQQIEHEPEEFLGQEMSLYGRNGITLTLVKDRPNVRAVLLSSNSSQKKIVTKRVRYAQIGRLQYPFSDENIVVSGYSKRFQDMTATEIIQYTLDRLPYNYINGISVYKGSIFDVTGIKKPDTNKVTVVTVIPPEQVQLAGQEELEQLVIINNSISYDLKSALVSDLVYEE